MIELVKELSDEWLRGRIGGREGIFPLNFVNIVVPLSGTGGVLATALYNFSPETWEDLDLQVRKVLICELFEQFDNLNHNLKRFSLFIRKGPRFYF